MVELRILLTRIIPHRCFIQDYLRPPNILVMRSGSKEDKDGMRLLFWMRLFVIV